MTRRCTKCGQIESLYTETLCWFCNQLKEEEEHYMDHFDEIASLFEESETNRVLINKDEYNDF